MVIEIRPSRGGFLRPFGCGWFICEYLMGHGPEDTTQIDPEVGPAPADINYSYKEALARATAQERAERIISRMVVSGIDVTEDKAEDIYQRELKKISRKFTHMRHHPFLVYFGVLKRLGWVEETGREEPSALQEGYPDAPPRKYYRLTHKGIEAPDYEWSRPQLVLYPHLGQEYFNEKRKGRQL